MLQWRQVCCSTRTWPCCFCPSPPAWLRWPSQGSGNSTNGRGIHLPPLTSPAREVLPHSDGKDKERFSREGVPTEKPCRLRTACRVKMMKARLRKKRGCCGSPLLGPFLQGSSPPEGKQDHPTIQKDTSWRARTMFCNWPSRQVPWPCTMQLGHQRLASLKGHEYARSDLSPSHC